MLRDSARALLELGEELGQTRLLWSLFCKDGTVNSRPELTDEGKAILREHLGELLTLAKRLGLPTSMKLLGRRLGYENNEPETEAEFDVIAEVLRDELDSKLFLFVPQDRAVFWERDDLLSDSAKAKFPKAVGELRAAGNAYAAALPEGSIYYSMRALEHGLRALARDVDLTFDVQNWQNIINEIEAKLEAWRKNGIPGMEKPAKDDRLRFLSEAAKEFAYFKDGWRNYVAHAKAPYTDHQAHTVLNHVTNFVERLSDWLGE